MMHTLGQNIVLFIALALLVVLVALTIFGRKTKKYKITLANNEIMHVTRRPWDGMDDDKNGKCYHKEDGKRIWFSNHFTIIKEEE